jgi:hypothetical protein
MLFRRGTETLLAAVLILSLFLKVSGGTNAETADPAKVQDRVASLLQRHGFEVTRIPPDVDLISLAAVKGACRMLIAVLSPHGWHRDVIRKLAPPGSETIFVFDGGIYREQPTLRTRAAHYQTRLLRYAGFDEPARPVLGVLGPSTCELERMVNWSELAVIPPL